MASNFVQVIAVTGGKGGVGKSNVAVNLSIALSDLGRRVVLLDADLGLANVDVLLGLSPRKNIADVLAGNSSLLDVMVTGPSGIQIIPASSGTQALTSLCATQHAGLIQAFSALAHHMDVLVIDTAAGISNTVTSFLQAAQEILLVVTHEPTAMTDAYALIKILNRDYGVTRFRIVASMVRTAHEGQILFHKLRQVAERFLDLVLSYEGFLPWDEHVKKAVNRQRAVLDVFPQSSIAMAIKVLAKKVEKWPVQRIPKGQVEFFIERLVSVSYRPASVIG